MRTRGALIGAAGVLLALAPTPALAHSGLESSSPAAGSLLATAPSRLRLVFDQPVSSTAAVTVLDGCRRSVASGVVVDGRTLVVTLAEGQPGDWRVDFSVLAPHDGHLTADAVTFAVSGSPSCPAETTGARAVTTASAHGGAGVVPVALASFAVLGGAVLVRRATDTSRRTR